MRYAIILAAGESSRYGGETNKLDELLFGKSVLSHSVDVFRRVADAVIVVGRQVQGTLYAEGGETRFLSVLSALRLLPDRPDGTVAIHDGARPFVSEQFVTGLYQSAEQFGSAVPRLPVTDTLYRVEGGCEVADRNLFWTVQTPQVFDAAKFARAARHAAQCNLSCTDDSSLYLCEGNEVHFVPGVPSNVKITYKGDLPDFRIGTGFDVHPFGEGNGVTLGGVVIPFAKRLVGHSDADALCHAICDAVLSASGQPDIGHQFPDTDERYRGADSTLLLARCVQLAEERGFHVVNVSATVVCQAPKISPHINAMSARLADVLHVVPSCVNISATTTEHLGALGRGDGIACQAVCLLRNLFFT